MKKGTMIVVLTIFLAVVLAWAINAIAESNFYDSNCGGCHGTPPPNSSQTCAGCHAHGTHNSIAGSGLNVSATTDKSEYAPNEDIIVTIQGGSGQGGWMRAKLFDKDCSAAGADCDTSLSGLDVLAFATNPCPSCPFQFGGKDGVTTSYPVVMTVSAPSAPGTYTWSASWYGNRYDRDQRGGTTDFGPLWTPDPSNANHGDEIVTFTFDVAGIPPAAKPMPGIPLLLLDN